MPFSLFSRALPRPLAAAVPPASSRHWNPGNYIAEIATDTDSLFDQIAQRLNDDVAGNYKGVMIRKTWPQLEAGMGDYTAGFKAIDDRLAQIAALNGRRLILFIQVKTFGANTNAVPSYMRNSATYADGKNYYTTRDGVVNQGSRNGQYAYESAIGGPGGYVPNMHVAAVRERWEALMDAFATRFNGNEYLEAIVINEASVSQPIGSVGAASEINSKGVVITRPNTDGDEWVGLDTWYTNMAAAHLNMRSLLQNIQICQWINGPRPKMSTYSNQTLVEGWVPIIAGHGIGLGMTDLCINDVGFQYVPETTPGGTYFSDHPGNIFLIQQFGQGNGIVVGHASSETYRGSVANRNQGIPPNKHSPVYPGPEQTRQQTQAFAKNVVGVTHLCWAHNKEDDPFHPGMTMNEVTDAFIANPLSDISTIETRPVGWDGSPVQITRNDADYFLPLTHTLVPTNGSGPPALARSTTIWLYPDNGGKMVAVPASAAAFGGARRGWNQVSATSEDLAHVNWAKLNLTATTATLLLSAASTSPQYTYDGAPNNSMTAGQYWIGKYRVQYIDIQYVQLFGVSGGFGFGQYCNFDLVNGDYTATGCTATITLVSSGIWDISILLTTTSTISGSGVGICLADSQSAARVANYTGDGAKSLGVLHYQITNVTGQAEQTVDEYVSKGVLAAPYHGAGVDGMKWFTTNKDGTPIPPSSLPGLATNHAAVTNTMLWCRDYTNAAWVKTNVTPAKTQIGLDNAANSCSLLTATAANATILQTITAAAAGCTGWYVTRAAGTGNIYITRDNTNWTDITSLINSDTPTLVGIENTSVLNPVVGFKWDTSGDAIIVDCGINHLGTKLHYLPILTTSAAITVGAQTLTYPKTGNIIDQEGTVLGTVTMDDWTGVDGSIVGSSTRGLFATATGASAKDGTNTPTGAADTPSGTVDIGMKYTTDYMRAMSDAGFGTATDYTGTLATDLTNIAIGAGFTGYIKDVAIWKEAINDYQMRNMT